MLEPGKERAILIRRWRGAVFALLIACLALLATSCGGGYKEARPTASASTAPAVTNGSPTTPPQTATATSTTPPVSDLPPIVRDMLERVAAGRNLVAPPVLAADVISRAQLPAILEAAFTEADRRWFAETTTLYRLLGYLGPGDDYYDIYMTFARQAVIGLYDPLSDHLYVVTDDGRGWDELNAAERETLAHEVVHAIQDYHFALDRTFEATLEDRDRNLAFIAVVEGDAVVHESLAGERRGLLPAGRLYALADFSQAGGIPAAIERELRFPYTEGADWVMGLKERDGTATIDELLRDPPQTTAVVLHPERGVRWEPERPGLADLSAAAGGGWERESGGSFGPFHWRNLLQTRLPGLAAAQAASAWLGDRYAVYRKGDESVVVFRVNAGEALLRQVNAMLIESGDASEGGGVLRAALSGGRYAFTTAVEGGFILVIGSDEETADAAFGALRGG